VSRVMGVISYGQSVAKILIDPLSKSPINIFTGLMII
jgi:hypothetical protein